MRWIVVPILVSLLGCNRMHNALNHEIFRCGSVSSSDERLLEIDEASGFEARLIKGGTVKPPITTIKGCLIISKEDEDSTLLVRSKADAGLGLMNAVSRIPYGYSMLSLESSTSLVQSSRLVHCAATELQMRDQFPLVFSESTEQRAQFPLVDFRILDENRQIVHQETMPVRENSLPLDLADGRYIVELTNFDAFDNKRPAAESCAVVVDRHAPQLEVKKTGLEAYKKGSPLLKVAPGQKVSFESKDKNATEIYFCLAKRESESVFTQECSSDSFQTSTDSIVMPDSGVWDLTAYAMDAVGNKSAYAQATFAVYQKDVIDQVRTLNNQIAELQTNNLDFRAFKTFQQLVQVASKLSLSEEIREIYWKLLGRFQSIALNTRLLWQLNADDFGSRIQSIRSPEAEHAAVIFAEKLVLMDGAENRTIDGKYINIGYIGPRSLVAFREGALDFYEGLEKINTVSLGDRPAARTGMGSSAIRMGIDLPRNDSPAIRMGTDYLKKLIFVIYGGAGPARFDPENDEMTQEAKLLVFTDKDDLSKRKLISFPHPVGKDKPVAMLYMKYPFRWPQAPDFSSSPDGNFVYLPLVEYLLRVSTETWTTELKKEADSCDFSQLIVATDTEMYYTATNCGLRRMTWDTMDNPTLLSADVKTIAQRPGLRVPKLVALGGTAGHEQILEYSFGSDDPWSYHLNQSYKTIEFDPSRDDLIWASDGRMTSRIEYRNTNSNYGASVVSFPAPSDVLLPLAGTNQNRVALIRDKLVSRYRLTTDTNPLFPEGKYCGTRCDSFPEQHKMVGTTQNQLTLNVVDTMTWKTYSARRTKPIKGYTACGQQLICWVEDKDFVVWNLATDEKNVRANVERGTDNGRMQYLSRLQCVTFSDSMGANIIISLEKDAAQILNLKLGYLPQSPFFTTYEKIFPNETITLRLYLKDGSLVKTIETNETSYGSDRTWVSPIDGTFYYAKRQEIVKIDPETLSETLYKAPEGFEFMRVRDDSFAVAKPFGSPDPTRSSPVYLFNLKDASLRKAPFAQQFEPSLGGAFRFDSGVYDASGDIFLLDARSMMTTRDEFQLALTYKLMDGIYVAPLRVDPSALNQLLNRWPLAPLQNFDAP